LTALVLSTGCETAAKTGIKVPKGVDAEVQPISGAFTPSKLAAYFAKRIAKTTGRISEEPEV